MTSTKSCDDKSIQSKIDELTKEFDSKAKELEDRTKEFDKFREERTGELLRLQGAYKALKELLHAD